MSGEAFLSNNHAQAHICYGLRKETTRSNFAVYLGPCYYIGVEGIPPAPATDYEGFGAYASAQAVTKFAYDIGLGLELFAELSAKQTLSGFKIIVFFSGAYRGVKKNYNPNVRSENPG